MASIEWISQSIEIAISKLLKNHNINPHDIIINIPTSRIISSKKNLSYIRTKPQEPISLEELDFIIWKAERESLYEAKTDIKNRTWYSEIDMKLITSSITSMIIDDCKVSNPIWFTGKEIHISVLNIFIPSSRYNTLMTIWNYLWKNILSILPIEFCLPKILSNSEFAYDNVIFIDIWNTKTSLIIQKAWVIMWFDTIDIWIDDLLKSIQEKTGEVNIEILHKYEKDGEYIQEKKDFLSVWEEWFILILKEILQTNLIPYRIFLSGWWDNKFVRDYIKDINLNKYGLHSLRPFSFIHIDIEKDIVLSWNKTIFTKTSYGLLSMILASQEIINYTNNPILLIIKNFLEKNEI
jgi:hypothetical protein